MRDYRPGQWVTLDARTARKEFRELMREMPSRIDELQNLLKKYGLELGADAASLQRLNDWFLSNITADREGIYPTKEWRSVALDIGLFIGEHARRERPTLRWEIVSTGPSFVDYRRHVLSGFTNVPYTKYRFSPSNAVFVYALNAIAGDEDEIVLVGDMPMSFTHRPLDRDELPKLMSGLLERA
ncbi:hypothetical protein [Orlajensenia leifsoniae]|uniref:Uncharacterized protein n=1 Tax=Orlajensenia leifsoniae TaxID=2561933 RepID=A0A4Y9QSY7_9MICO|nr:hypothetical protein [Leifsonia flava]TFV95287.1 hypothetical protein E4M00_14635 [Leifsonia flava]